MNRSRIFNLLVMGLALVVGATGCKKHIDKSLTPLGQTRAEVKPDTRKSEPLTPGNSVATPFRNEAPLTTTIPTEVKPGEPIPLLGGEGSLERDYNFDPDKFKSDTVYFDFDQSAVKAKERPKIEEVATYLKSSAGAGQKMLVEGHCDERGTEEYNRALGERRALSVREYLIRSGVASDRVFTRSYGEDRPAVQGHDEAAWSKNRRGAFVVLTPK